MFTLSQITELLGWASIINIGFLLLTTILIVAMKNTAAAIHSKMFGIPEGDLPAIYFKYLASYKILTLIFMVAPYFALKIMGY